MTLLAGLAPEVRPGEHGPAAAGHPAMVPDALLVERLIGDEHASWWPEPLPQMLRAFYQSRLHQPAWFAGAQPHPAAWQLRDALHEAPDDGLPVATAAVAAADRALAARRASSAELVRADLTLSAAFLQHAHALAHGVVDHAGANGGWVVHEREADLVGALATGLERGDVREALAAVRPGHPEYARLRAVLHEYRRIAARGGWPMVPEGVLLERAESASSRSEERDDSRIEALTALRVSLALRGDLDPEEAAEPRDAHVMHEALETAVRRFQARHGLDPDGIVGPLTIAQLNVPVEDRVRQIAVNLERWRWLPDDLGVDHVRVNVPGFRLDAFEAGRRAFGMRVVVGHERQVDQTPIFSDEISYLEFSPYWEVPDGVTRRTLLPRILDDPSYLERRGFEVVDGWHEGAPRVPAHAVDWSRAPGHFPYRLRQRPGPVNALGQVKFMFPNRFHVYLHDTPGDHVFDRVDRALSHGCVRVERPVDLAAWLLREDGWDEPAIRAAMGRPAPITAPLARPTPVHLLYLTAWADDAGDVQFRDDLYGYDEIHASRIPGSDLTRHAARPAPQPA